MTLPVGQAIIINMPEINRLHTEMAKLTKLDLHVLLSRVFVERHHPDDQGVYNLCIHSKCPACFFAQEFDFPAKNQSGIRDCMLVHRDKMKGN